MTAAPAPSPAVVVAVLNALTEATGPLHLPDLAIAAGVSGRDAEAAVQHLRTAGLSPVCSGSEGYWIARNLGELRADIARGDRRLRTMHATRRGQRKLLRRLEAERVEVVEVLSVWATVAA